MIGAKVMASVRLESSNNDSLVTLSPVRLHDNGYGGKNRTLELLPEFFPIFLHSIESLKFELAEIS